MLATPENTCVLILAGGQGRRMQGEDKGLVVWKKRHLIEYVLQVVQQEFSHIVISANRNHQAYQKFNYPVIEDSVSGYQGPLAGLLSAMQFCPAAEYILLLPCDCPTVPGDLFIRLATALQQSEGKKIAIADDGERLQPLFGLYHHSLITALETAINSGHLKVQRFIMETSYVTANYADQPDVFKNFNKPDDLV